jgi:hypothetical protein
MIDILHAYAHVFAMIFALVANVLLFRFSGHVFMAPGVFLHSLVRRDKPGADASRKDVAREDLVQLALAIGFWIPAWVIGYGLIPGGK